MVQTLESFNTSDINDQILNQHNLQVCLRLFCHKELRIKIAKHPNSIVSFVLTSQVQPYPGNIDELAALAAAQQSLPNQAALSPMDFIAANGTTQLYPYDQILGTTVPPVPKDPNDPFYHGGFNTGVNIVQHIGEFRCFFVFFLV